MKQDIDVEEIFEYCQNTINKAIIETSRFGIKSYDIVILYNKFNKNKENEIKYIEERFNNSHEEKHEIMEYFFNLIIEEFNKVTEGILISFKENNEPLTDLYIRRYIWYLQLFACIPKKILNEDISRVFNRMLKNSTNISDHEFFEKIYLYSSKDKDRNELLMNEYNNAINYMVCYIGKEI